MPDINWVIARRRLLAKQDAEKKQAEAAKVETKK